MPARLILNADDFGLTLGVNRAVLELHLRGVLTSATLMANSLAFDDAVALALAHPTLGVGCHIVLTDGVPVSPPDSVPTLLGPDRRAFRPKLTSFVLALFRGQIDEEEIAIEALAQVQKLQRAGVPITHLDTHKHTHLFPQVARPLLRIAESAAVPAIRNPFEPAWARALNHGSLMRQLQLKLLGRLEPQFRAHPQIANGTIKTTDGSIGVSATGKLDPASLAQLLAALPPAGTFELVCHPGYNDVDLDAISTRLRQHRDIERDALLTQLPLRLAQPNPPELIHYGCVATVSPTDRLCKPRNRSPL
jgi:predicted glycoside hydrolase/deacetylase ChbG (UPF0249 family)